MVKSSRKQMSAYLLETGCLQREEGPGVPGCRQGPAGGGHRWGLVLPAPASLIRRSSGPESSTQDVSLVMTSLPSGLLQNHL